mmetsp:Transcript_8337/g.19406  ORF Transcript_8337/g.19406 Transcript_8337/m.19406 type:complete len:287 (-) Transcript_8337:75-935(-)
MMQDGSDETPKAFEPGTSSAPALTASSVFRCLSVDDDSSDEDSSTQVAAAVPRQISESREAGGAAAHQVVAESAGALQGGGGVEEEDDSDDWDIGIRWIVRNNKLLVAGFDEGCVAEAKGVLTGDILRAVGRTDVLHLKENADGTHPAEELLFGRRNSKCQLTLLRVSKAGAGKSEGKTPLLEFTCMLPRNLHAPDDSEASRTVSAPSRTPSGGEKAVAQAAGDMAGAAVGASAGGAQLAPEAGLSYSPYSGLSHGPEVGLSRAGPEAGLSQDMVGDPPIQGLLVD